MRARFRSWWEQIKQHRVDIEVVTIVLVVVIVLIIAGYWFDWTGFNGFNKVSTVHTISGPSAGTVTRTEEYQPGKSLWDWLQLLFIPAVLTLGAVWIAARQNHDLQIAERLRQAERELAEDKYREDTLQDHIDKMSELLLVLQRDFLKKPRHDPGDPYVLLCLQTILASR